MCKRRWCSRALPVCNTSPKVTLNAAETRTAQAPPIIELKGEKGGGGGTKPTEERFGAAGGRLTS